MATDGNGVPLGVVSAGANRHDSPLLGPTLQAATAQVGPHWPAEVTVHLDAGYDSGVTRTLLDGPGLYGDIARKGVPAPVQVGERWVVERSHSWINGYGKLRRCTDRNGKTAHLDFEDLMFERDYRAAAAYSRSKLATTIFGIELSRRLRAAGSPIVSALAHPGLTRTNLTPRAWEHRGRFGRLIAWLGLLATQPVEQGALSQLRAATETGVRGGQFFGPARLRETRGRVTDARLNHDAADPAVGTQLWTAAEELTGVSYL